jgi:predicted RNA-binding protein with PUA-like domain
MSHWLIKSEPDVYSWDQLVKDKHTVWDGIRSYASRLHLKSMKKGDSVFFYHSNKGMEIVGIASVSKEAFPEPGTDDTWFAIEIKPLKKILKPVTLVDIKKEKSLSNMALIRIGRLSVQPVSEKEWQTIMKMGGMETEL